MGYWIHGSKFIANANKIVLHSDDESAKATKNGWLYIQITKFLKLSTAVFKIGV